MPNPPMKPGDIPTPVTAKERRRWAAEEAKLEATNQRPNVDPVEQEKRYEFDRCTQSKYATHRFVLGGKCEFCGRHWQDCLKQKGTA